MKSLDAAYYLAESIYVPKGQKKDYHKYLYRYYLPMLQEWKKRGLIYHHEVYDYIFTNVKNLQFLSWNHLKLIHLKDQASAEIIFKGLNLMPDLEGKKIIRREILVSTPNSNYPIPLPQAKNRSLPLFFAVEYVDVHEPYLEEFRQIMIKNNGPAMKYIMMNRNWCYNFIALETIEVLGHSPEIPTWNQLHIIGLYPDAVLRYKKDFNEGLRRANNTSFKENFKRLEEIRTMLYKTGNKRVEL